MHPFLEPRSPLLRRHNLLGRHASRVIPFPAFLTDSISLSIFLLLPYTSQLSSSLASSLCVSSVHPHDNETGLGHLYGYGDVVDKARSAQVKKNTRI